MLARLLHRSPDPKRPDITDLAVLPWSEFSPRSDTAPAVERPPWKEPEPYSDLTESASDQASDSTRSDTDVNTETVEQYETLKPWQLQGVSRAHYYRRNKWNRMTTELEQAQADRTRLEGELAAAKAEFDLLGADRARLETELATLKQSASAPAISDRLKAILVLHGFRLPKLEEFLALPEDQFIAQMAAAQKAKEAEHV